MGKAVQLSLRSPVLSIPNDVDSDLLISHLAGPLTPDARQAFRRAAEDAFPVRAKALSTGPSLRCNAPILTRRRIIARAGTSAVNHA